MSTATESLVPRETAGPPPTPAVSVESPFPFHAVPRIWQWTREFERAVSDDFAPKTLEQFLRVWDAKEDNGQRSWGVWRGEELGGLVTFDAYSPVAGVSHFMLKRNFWGRETSEPALRVVYSQLFAEGFKKILGMVFAHNSNMISLAKRIGFQKEGTLKEQTLQGGQPVDMVMLGLTKGDFEKCLP